MTWKDGWTSTTADGQRSAQFEHTILITETGHEILTARKETSLLLSSWSRNDDDDCRVNICVSDSTLISLDLLLINQNVKQTA